VEEVSEVLEAVDNNDFELMEEELGDLLLQVVMHACLAEEQNRFDFEDVARGISDKLIRRHPHVFGDKAEKVDTTGEVIDRWELIKAEEKKKKFGENEKISIFKNLPPRLPALLFANDIYKRVTKNGLEEKGEWEENNASVSAQELNEGLAGKALFELVAACQKSGIDPELALRRFSSAQVKKLED
jgi:XTP/dITP diphosphohydrolase/tetrapyrrole methylase family protein/MazG family protein